MFFFIVSLSLLPGFFHFLILPSHPLHSVLSTIRFSFRVEYDADAPHSSCIPCSGADNQHCDFYWAAEAVEWAYTSMLDDIESTRSKYPGEEGEERDETQTETEFRMDVQHES